MEDVKKILKSILVSTPKKLKVYELNLEYKAIVGSNIPFGKFGYSDLVGFLKSLSDILSVKGDDVFCTVDVLSNRITHTKRRKKKKKKSFSDTRNDQIALRTTPVHQRQDEVFLLTSNTPGCFQRITQDGILSHISNPLGVNVDMHIDYRKEKLQFAAEIDYGRLAAINRGQLMRELEKREQGMQTEEKKQLRYPKSEITIEKNGERIKINPQSGKIEKKLNFEENYISATIMQCVKNTGSFTKNSNNIPSIEEVQSETKKIVAVDYKSATNRTEQTDISAVNQTPISLMDEPIPKSLPEVPKIFRKPTPEDMIDFGCVVTRPGCKPASKALPFIEMLRLVKRLNLNGTK
ncbi:uncharacterized protein LOC123320070 [Coccinella septempunctata]|uniref:uncharacterized protein LOC123320070 n=1 Tax=Coccinella septempunctata TaxID=41139 RepID=UPI001D090D28|nr:uncharacterized protein LOC123320070 [Coccinella septempunctata]